VPRAADGDRFEILSALEYEDKHFVTRYGDPADVLHFAFEPMGKSDAPSRTEP
jgi:hypothetical protein